MGISAVKKFLAAATAPLASRLRRKSTPLLGIALGFGLAATGAVRAAEAGGGNIPLWLPPLPFALVALALFVLGFLAWFTGSDR